MKITRSTSGAALVCRNASDEPLYRLFSLISEEEGRLDPLDIAFPCAEKDIFPSLCQSKGSARTGQEMRPYSITCPDQSVRNLCPRTGRGPVAV